MSGKPWDNLGQNVNAGILSILVTFHTTLLAQTIKRLRIGKTKYNRRLMIWGVIFSVKRLRRIKKINSKED